MITYNGERIVDAAFAEQVCMRQSPGYLAVKWLPTDR